MVEGKNSRTALDIRIGMVVLIAILSLPAITPEKAAWLTCFIPAPVFYYLACFGQRDGSVLIRNSILVAAGVALLFGSLPLLIFSLTLVPLGFVFYQAAQMRATPAHAGLNGIFALGAAWLLFWLIFGLVERINPYIELINALDRGLIGAVNLYREEAGLSGNAWKNFELAIEQLRVVIPKVLPALLITSILYTVWLNQTLGNWLLRKKRQSLAPWQNFKEWQLPDNLVWGIILGSVSIILFTPPIQTIGVNVIIIWGALFFIQGAAVLASLLNKWGLPQPLRVLIYAFVVIQTFGIIILSVIGLADVWADFRKIKTPEKTTKKTFNDDHHN